MTKLSKFMALILRHQPERFALELDEEGWLPLSEVMDVVRGLPNFRWANRSDVMHIVEQGTGDGKKRFEVGSLSTIPRKLSVWRRRFRHGSWTLKREAGRCNSCHRGLASS